ncbi:hypothetical protein, partial [Intestinimonas butyriciproducens]|uniref:hypothetical protein n=1 Tax=Intestinimonas butyriciproducens TaxID=1297617 RepID=UPI001AB04B19
PLANKGKSCLFWNKNEEVMMKKNLHRTALLLSIGLPYGMHAGEIPDKPNILIFIADDLGWEEVGAYGHPVVRTPN